MSVRQTAIRALALLPCVVAFGLTVCPSATLRAQASPSAFTAGYRYNAAGQVTGTISPDPDDAGVIKYGAVRNSYDAAGRLTQVEHGELSAWQSEAVAPASWTGFTIFRTITIVYDGDRKALASISSGGSTFALSQYTYDSVGRLVCTATRMNPAIYGSLPASACTLGTSSSYGPDRIVKNVYDDAGQLLQVREGIGTADEAAEVTYTYTDNGKRKFVIDGGGARAELRYDEFDWQIRWVFPSATMPSAYNDSTPATALASAGALNENDYEQYGYDPAGNRTSLRKRDGSLLTFTYDELNRMKTKIVPSRADLTAAQTRDVFYAYDLRGLQTEARFDSLSGEGISSNYDGFGRLSSTMTNMGGTTRSLAYHHDPNGNRDELTYPDGVKTPFTYDGLNRMTGIKRDVGGSTVSLATIAYNEKAKRLSVVYGPGNNTYYTWDGLSRLATSKDAFNGGISSTSTFGYNPASQLLSVSRTNDTYAWTGHYNVNRGYATNGLNQYGTAGPTSFQYDDNGNLKQSSSSAGTINYLYDVENRLVQASGASNASLVYDPLGRLFETSGGSAGITRFLFDGDELVAEHNSAGAMLRRYVHGAGVDDPVVWYEGAGFGVPRYLHTDHQGSITVVANGAAQPLQINSYDEYGIPKATNLGRFQYTGQAWISELQMYYYKARIYSPYLGRFMQIDPIGYDDQVNLYAYVRSDPVNRTDPTGTQDSFELATQRDDRAYLNGEISEDEYRMRQQARGAGGVLGAGTVGVAIATRGAGLPALANFVLRSLHTSARIAWNSAWKQAGFKSAGEVGRVVGWTGSKEAILAHAARLDGAAVAAMRQQHGLTREVVKAAERLYRSAQRVENAAGRTKGGEIAGARAHLMRRILELW